MQVHPLPVCSLKHFMRQSKKIILTLLCPVASMQSQKESLKYHLVMKSVVLGLYSLVLASLG